MKRKNVKEVIAFRADPDLIDKVRHLPNRSKLFRLALLSIVERREALTDKQVEALAEVSKEIRRVGINLNTLTRYAAAAFNDRQKEPPDMQEVEKVARQFSELCDRVSKIIRKWS